MPSVLEEHLEDIVPLVFEERSEDVECTEEERSVYVERSEDVDAVSDTTDIVLSDTDTEEEDTLEEDCTAEEFIEEEGSIEDVATTWV